jgi:acyl-CoA thioesterase-1
LVVLATGAAAAEPYRVLALGDSLTAGLGLQREAAFPARLEGALRAGGHGVEVIDAGVSGDTTAGGLARLEWTLSGPGGPPDAVIVELGANDGLRGLDPAATRANLDAIVGRLKGAGVRVLVAGMVAPPNLGPRYGARFNAMFAEIAARHDVLLYPFFLEGVAAVPALNQADGIHPNARGVDEIVRRILPYVEKLMAGKS